VAAEVPGAAVVRRRSEAVSNRLPPRPGCRWRRFSRSPPSRSEISAARQGEGGGCDRGSLAPVTLWALHGCGDSGSSRSPHGRSLTSGSRTPRRRSRPALDPVLGRLHPRAALQEADPLAPPRRRSPCFDEAGITSSAPRVSSSAKCGPGRGEAITAAHLLVGLAQAKSRRGSGSPRGAVPRSRSRAFALIYERSQDRLGLSPRGHRSAARHAPPPASGISSGKSLVHRLAYARSSSSR